jgi:hydroxymethylbilane synthase
LNDEPSFQCVAAERSFLQAMGGGCLSPVAAQGTIDKGMLTLRAISFRDGKVSRTEKTGPVEKAVELGREAAAAVR